jgi:hypothetical protein
MAYIQSMETQADINTCLPANGKIECEDEGGGS